MFSGKGRRVCRIGAPPLPSGRVLSDTTSCSHILSMGQRGKGNERHLGCTISDEVLALLLKSALNMRGEQRPPRPVLLRGLYAN